MNRTAPLYRPKPGDRVIDRYRILKIGEPESNRHGVVLRATFFDTRVRWGDGMESSVGPFTLVLDTEDGDAAVSAEGADG